MMAKALGQPRSKGILTTTLKNWRVNGRHDIYDKALDRIPTDHHDYFKKALAR